MNGRTNQSISRSRLWTGRILSLIVVLFLIFDATIHLLVITPVIDSFNQLGLPVSLAVTFGVIELICLILYVVPATSILGAVLLTGYLGGAIAIQLRIGAPLFSTALFPVYLGVLMWGSLVLRERRLASFLVSGKSAES